MALIESPMGRLSTLLRAVLAKDSREPSSWALLSDRLHDLDALTPFELTVLPLLVERWQREKRDLERFPLLRGLRRKMVVRNRLLVTGARSALAGLRTAGIDAIALKGVGLAGRGLPESGLRAFADVDLWVRPSQYTAACALLGRPQARLQPELHATTMRDAMGRDIDVHSVPSHLFARRRLDAAEAETPFERTWQRRTSDEPALADLVYYSFLNPLFSHAPGEDRAAFALIELDAVLAHVNVSAETLAGVVAHARADSTLAVFAEHLDWIGPGASATLDRFLAEWVEPALTPSDRALRTWAGGLQRRTGFDPLSRLELRERTYARRRAPRGSGDEALLLLASLAQAVQMNPLLPLLWLSRGSSWRRLRRVAASLVRVSRSPKPSEQPEPNR